MSFALGVILKTTILLALAGLMTLGLRRASASMRHALWALALLAALLLPAASVLLPKVSLALLPEERVLRTADSFLPDDRLGRGQGSGSRTSPSPTAGLSTSSPLVLQEDAQPPAFALSPNQVFLLLWSLGAGVVLVRLLIGSLTVRGLARRSIPIDSPIWIDILDDLKAQLGLTAPIRLCVAERTIPPMTWGILRHVVLLPPSADEWSRARRHLVLAHELSHIRRNDGVVQMMLQAVCSLYWFHPLVWYAARRLRIERECACDDQVLKLGADAEHYADHLLQVARTINPGGGLSMSAVAMAHRSQLETRLLSILDSRTRRQAVSSLTTALLLSAIAVATLSIAALQITARPGNFRPNTVTAPAGFPPPPEFDAAIGKDVDPVDTETQTLAVVHGTLREVGANTPIANALVRLTSLRPSDGEIPSLFETETRTDGRFAVKDLPAGQYRLDFEREGYVRLHSAGDPTELTVLSGQPPEALHVRLMRGPAISGRVFDEDGKVKASAHVELLRMDFRDGERALLPSDVSMVTDKLGEYRLHGLQPGEYYLRVRPRAGGSDFLPVYFPGVTDSSYATPISVRAGADISGVDLSLTRGNLHSVSLQIEVAAPVPANPELSFYINPRSTAGSVIAGAVQFHSGGANRYVSPLLAPGSYEIEVYLRDPDPIRWARTTVEIDDHDVDAGKLVIGPGVWIQGHITAAEQLPVSVRRGRLLVMLRPLDGSVFLLPSAQVADDGSFVIPRVPERRFRIELAGLPPEVYFSSGRYNGREVRETGITVSANARSVLDLSIASSGGVVAGVVRNAKDEPVSNGTVLLVPKNRENLNLYRTASTDQFGVFSIPGVPPGEYGVLASKDTAARTLLDPVVLKIVEDQITKVVVQRGFTNTINVRAISP